MTTIRLIAIVAILATAFAGVSAAESKPNILFIVSDDQGYADLGVHGSRDIQTPALDQLATEGIRFTDGYVSGAWCSPTRAALMTGRYQGRYGYATHTPKDGGLPLTETTIADRLRAVGYATGLVGKWHLGSEPQYHPLKRGFDEFYGFLGGLLNNSFKPTDILRGTEPVTEMDYTTDAFAREAVSFIERHKDRPWFLYLCFNAVHVPMQSPDDRLAKFAGIADQKRRRYAAMLFAMDEAIASVRKALADTKQDRNTFVIFISDNGGPTDMVGSVNGSRNDPLRGSKKSTLEGGVRVPFIVAWPGQLTPAIYREPVIQLDLTATALALAGVDVKLDGVNLMPFLTGSASGAPHDALYWRYGNQMAIRVGHYKLVRYDKRVDTPNLKLGKEVTAARLYNLADDIGETNDLAGSMPEKVLELQNKWDQWDTGNVESPGSGSARGKGAEPGASGH